MTLSVGVRTCSKTFIASGMPSSIFAGWRHHHDVRDNTRVLASGHRTATFMHLFESAFGLAVLAVCGFEAGAPVSAHASTDRVECGLAAVALGGGGGLNGLRR